MASYERGKCSSPIISSSSFYCIDRAKMFPVFSVLSSLYVFFSYGVHQFKVVRSIIPHMTTCNFNCRFYSHFTEGMRLRVKFAINRIPLRLQHRATDMVYKHRLREVLFPTGRHSPHRSFLPRSGYLMVRKKTEKTFKTCDTVKAACKHTWL